MVKSDMALRLPKTAIVSILPIADTQILVLNVGYRHLTDLQLHVCLLKKKTPDLPGF